MLLVTLGGLFVALGLPMAKRWVPRNRWYGLRTPQTLGDDRIWYPANARSGVDFIILGAIAIVVGIGLRMTPCPRNSGSPRAASSSSLARYSSRSGASSTPGS